MVTAYIELGLQEWGITEAETRKKIADRLFPTGFAHLLRETPTITERWFDEVMRNNDNLDIDRRMRDWTI